LLEAASNVSSRRNSGDDEKHRDRSERRSKEDAAKDKYGDIYGQKLRFNDLLRDSRSDRSTMQNCSACTRVENAELKVFPRVG